MTWGTAKYQPEFSNEKHNIQVWTTYFHLVDKETGKIVLNEDGTIALFTDRHGEYIGDEPDDVDELDHASDTWTFYSSEGRNEKVASFLTDLNNQRKENE